jgi:hypothetical protein
MISELIITSVFDSTTDLLDLVDSSPTYQVEFNERIVRKLRLIWLGAESWRSDVGRHAVPQAFRTASSPPVTQADIIG